MESKTDAKIISSDNEPLDQNKALNILVNAIHVGQTRGAWTLNEAEILIKAIRVFSKN